MRTLDICLRRTSQPRWGLALCRLVEPESRTLGVLDQAHSPDGGYVHRRNQDGSSQRNAPLGPSVHVVHRDVSRPMWGDALHLWVVGGGHASRDRHPIHGEHIVGAHRPHIHRLDSPVQGLRVKLDGCGIVRSIDLVPYKRLSNGRSMLINSFRHSKEGIRQCC